MAQSQSREIAGVKFTPLVVALNGAVGAAIGWEVSRIVKSYDAKILVFSGLLGFAIFQPIKTLPSSSVG